MLKKTLALVHLLLDSRFSRLAKRKRKRLLCRLKCDCWASLTNETCYCHLVGLKTLNLFSEQKYWVSRKLRPWKHRPQTSDLENRPWALCFRGLSFRGLRFRGMRFRDTCPKKLILNVKWCTKSHCGDMKRSWSPTSSKQTLVIMFSKS